MGGLSHRCSFGLAAGAFALVVCSATSYAADIAPQQSDALSLSVTSFLTPKQFDETGSVYGVRARSNLDNPSALQIAPDVSLTAAGENSISKRSIANTLSEPAPQDGTHSSMIVVDTSASGGVSDSGNIAGFGPAPSTRCELRGGKAVCTKDYLVAAPGSDLWSSAGDSPLLGPSYHNSSTAAPYVIGVATLINGAWPNLSPHQVADAFLSMANDFGGAGGVIPVTTPASLAAAITNTNSGILKQPMLVNSLDRETSVDLTRAVDGRSFDPTYAVMMNQFTDVMPFSFGANSPIGPLFASGYATDTTIPQLISGIYRGEHDYHDYDLRDFSLGAAVLPGIDLDIGYQTDMAGRFNNYDASASGAYDGLFLSASAVNSPYASLANGGSFVGSTIALASDLHLRFGEVLLSPEQGRFNVNAYSLADQFDGTRPFYDLRSVRGTMAGVSWDFASWGGLGMTATQIAEANGLLGGFNSSALSIASGANTTALGVSARIGFGDGWVTTASYSEGVTQLDLKPNNLFTSADNLHSRAYGIAVAKHDLFGKDSFGFAVTRPIQIYSGSADIGTAGSVNGDDNLAIDRISLTNIKPETDIELGYVTTFMDGALALQANAAYQLNTQGQTGTNSLAVVSRAKIKF